MDSLSPTPLPSASGGETSGGPGSVPRVPRAKAPFQSGRLIPSVGVAVSVKEGCHLSQLRLCQGLRSDRLGGWGGTTVLQASSAPTLSWFRPCFSQGARRWRTFPWGGCLCWGCFLSRPNGRPSQGCRETEREEASPRRAPHGLCACTPSLALCNSHSTAGGPSPASV